MWRMPIVPHFDQVLGGHRSLRGPKGIQADVFRPEEPMSLMIPSTILSESLAPSVPSGRSAVSQYPPLYFLRNDRPTSVITMFHLTTSAPSISCSMQALSSLRYAAVVCFPFAGSLITSLSLSSLKYAVFVARLSVSCVRRLAAVNWVAIKVFVLKTEISSHVHRSPASPLGQRPCSAMN